MGRFESDSVFTTPPVAASRLKSAPNGVLYGTLLRLRERNGQTATKWTQPPHRESGERCPLDPEPSRSPCSGSWNGPARLLQFGSPLSRGFESSRRSLIRWSGGLITVIRLLR